jgi:aryl-alcohol dehydrogenase-like predicted oxidoreductase
MKTIQLGQSDLQVTPICLGTMTFGEQVKEDLAHEILDLSIAKGINFLDTAEMYAVPVSPATFNLTEKIIGNWLEKRPGAREKLIIATKVAGPARGMPWVREGKTLITAADIEQACNESLKRLKTDYIDLYQIHWPFRTVPAFGTMYFDPSKYVHEVTPILEQLQALDRLQKAGKIRYIGLSNETPYGLHEFIRLSEEHSLPRVVSVQNVYNLVSRAVENGLDEVMFHDKVGLLAYSPLAAGLLTGKYDKSGITGPDAPVGTRISGYESVRKQRWGKPESLIGARRYNALAKDHGLTPTQLALAFCYTKWQVASTIIGVTSIAHLNEDIDAYQIQLSSEILSEIDQIRLEIRDPAI